jgi:hypothetical protein
MSQQPRRFLALRRTFFRPLVVPVALGALAPLAPSLAGLPIHQALTGNDLDHITRPLRPDYRLRKDGGVTLRICYNWSCTTQERLTFTATDVAEVTRHMAECPGESLHERVQRMRLGIWQMQLLARKYVPLLANDRAINDTDADLDGRADCVDHTSNTTTYLHVLSDLGQLPGWTIAAPEVRNVMNPHAVHWTPVVVDDRTHREWSVDSWFHPNGQLPLVMPVKDWAADKKAWEPPFSKLNPYPQYLSDLCPSAATTALVGP